MKTLLVSLTLLFLCLLPRAQAAEPSRVPAGAAVGALAQKNTVDFFTPEQDKGGLKNAAALDPALPNVLILGDSISIGYTRQVRAGLAGKANVIRPNANCGDTRMGLANLERWLGTNRWDVIHFNWGLWDLCFRNPQLNTKDNRDKVHGKISTPLAEYERNLETLVQRLQRTGAKLIWASTTVVPEGEIGRVVGDDVKYNAVAARVMLKHGVLINDLYATTKAFPPAMFRAPADVHYTPQGYARLAAQVVTHVSTALNASASNRKISGSTKAASKPVNSDKPNIVFILADDLGWADLGSYGSTFYETPNLDRLAKDGMRFTNAYAACNVCSPTRASILTGKSPARLHLTDWLPGRPDRADQKLKRPEIQPFLPLEEVTLAEALKDAGYQTALLGKWHLGESTDYYPEHQGFDLNLGGCGHGHPPSYFSPYGIPNLPDGPRGEYLNERLTDEALKFMESAAVKKEPFLLYFSHYAVHTPLQAKPQAIEKYKAKAAKLEKSGPEFIADHGRQVRQIQNHPAYGAMVESLDESVGRVLAKLKELNLETNTIVIFTSDNGGLSTAEGSPTSNLPLRTGKGWGYEGGVREPLLVRWPGVIAAGAVNPAPVITTDFYPTLLELAGLPLRPDQHTDGVSIAAGLKGSALPERPLFWHYPHYSNQGGPPHGAVRLGDFKLIEWYEDMNCELFDLTNDLGEQHDLAKENPAKAAKLKKLLHDWRKQVNAQMPTPNPNYRPSPKKSATQNL